jgi:hypothetical protein
VSGFQTDERPLKRLVPATQAALQLVEALLTLLPALTDEERLEVFEKLTDDYCRSCGREERGRFCQCQNDD